MQFYFSGNVSIRLGFSDKILEPLQPNIYWHIYESRRPTKAFVGCPIRMKFGA